MNRIAKFEKVSFEQFRKDWLDTFGEVEGYSDPETIKKIYDEIKLPQRATTGSAGYDFFLPYGTAIPIEEVAKIPTGIRCKMDNGWVLQIYPRSGHGFKYGVHLANTVGIIDADYYNSDNEGHIFMKMVNDSVLAQYMDLPKGAAFCQGIFLPFGVTEDDNTSEERNGGFGSTDRK